MSNIFTKIIKKEISSYILYEDDIVIVFLDIAQITKGHTLVVTKKQYIDIQEVPENIFSHLFRIVQKMSKVLMKTFNAQGLNIINNNGLVAGQTIFHYHVHLIPRFSSDEIKFQFFTKKSKLTIQDYQNIQQKILSNMQKNF
ncbi:MAG: HIT family protein [Vigna little leaf phytoplasma]|nr:HIT family protein [Vigna little leaf phytoplasma]